MEMLLIMLLLPLPIIAERAADPSASLWQTKAGARNLDCTRMSQAQAHERYPGKVPERAPRALADQQVDALACTRRFIDYGERPARDEAILSSLRRSVGELTEAASALEPKKELTWHVDAFYPDPLVASKISVAARTELAERGRRVSDRVPVLAAGDIAVLSGLSAKDAYEVACVRYFDQKALGENEAFLGIMIVDPRETQLHAGVCVNREWRWLR